MVQLANMVGSTYQISKGRSFSDQSNMMLKLCKSCYFISFDFVDYSWDLQVYALKSNRLYNFVEVSSIFGQLLFLRHIQSFRQT